MVLKGQFLERPTLIPVGELVLEGLAHRGHLQPGTLILPPVPSEGSGMDHVVGAELAFALARHGYPTLRFNYRGVGGSQGAISKRPQELLDDALAAFELAADNARTDAVAVASIGSSDAIALELARRKPVRALALVNPTLVRPVELDGLAAMPLGVVVAEHDEGQDRLAWSVALEKKEGAFTLVAGADRRWLRNLPQVGKAVAQVVMRVCGHGPSALID